MQHAAYNIQHTTSIPHLPHLRFMLGMPGRTLVMCPAHSTRAHSTGEGEGEKREGRERIV
jgi:hypothetical protein